MGEIFLIVCTQLLNIKSYHVPLELIRYCHWYELNCESVKKCNKNHM